MSAPSEHPEPASEQLFIRNATGLVREVRPLSSLVINYIVGSPVQVLGAVPHTALVVVVPGMHEPPAHISVRMAPEAQR